MSSAFITPFRRLLGASILLGLVLSPVNARVIDDFNGATKTNWTDFTFVPGFGLPTQSNGQFLFEQPPAGQAIFSGSQKTSQTFELKEGRTIEFRVDLIEGGGKDSFAIVGFIPTANPPTTLAGYGFAKSTTDILITKGIGNYFHNENPTPPIKNDRVTLVLKLTGKNGNVIINAQVLDMDADNAVIFDKTYVDTPAAEVMRNGKDTPQTPYLTSGYFTLFLYQDFAANAPENPYKAYFDNAEAFVTDTATLDDFNDNTKTAWTDFTFVPGFGLPAESNGQFRFEQPPAGQAIFSGSQKTSRAFDLVEGEQLKFSIDLIEGGGKDSFAIVGFIPTANPPTTLAGYGFAKSTTDILITKGIGNYFHNENPTPPIKNDRVTLVLSLTARNGNVIINGQVLDMDADNAVIFDKTFVDTPAAEVMRNGKDTPQAPYLTSGYFTLFLYQDFAANAPENPYKAYFDNAVVSAPPVGANVAPIISDLQPLEFSNFLPATTAVGFRVVDDKALANDKIVLYLNDQAITPTNGLTLTGGVSNRVATYTGLKSNVTYTARIEVTDSDNASVTNFLYFDTFAKSSFVVEVEDYNFNSGQFIDQPVPSAEGGGPDTVSYANQVGTQDVDFNETRTAPRAQDSIWRQSDPVRMAHSLDYTRDKYVAAGGADAGVFDYVVGDLAAGEWLQYTRTFPAGTYEIYLREAIVNMDAGESVLELVTGDRTQPNATTRVLGSFLGRKSGFKFRNFPLTDGLGRSTVVVRLSGVTTLRLRHVTPDSADGNRYLTYLLFLPVADAGQQGPTVASVSPASGATVETLTPAISVTIQNRDTTVRTNTIELSVNGKKVAADIKGDTNGATVSYTFAQVPAAGSKNSAQIRFTDSAGVETSFGWDFIITYKTLDPANRAAGQGLTRGFKMRVVQAPIDLPQENSLGRAESQLAPNSPIPKAVDINTVTDLVNFNKRPDTSAGIFPDDLPVPGIDANVNGDNDFAVEILAYLDLSVGIYRFGVISDDGYKISSGTSLADTGAAAIAFHNGGPANETFDFLVSQPGLYPFRFVWYERGGAGYAEWFSQDIASGSSALINGPESWAVKAYREISAPAVQVFSAATANGPYAADASAAVNESAKTITVPVTGSSRFFKIQGGTVTQPITIKTFRVTGGNLVLTY